MAVNVLRKKLDFIFLLFTEVTVTHTVLIPTQSLHITEQYMCLLSHLIYRSQICVGLLKHVAVSTVLINKVFEPVTCNFSKYLFICAQRSHRCSLCLTDSILFDKTIMYVNRYVAK